MGGSVSREDEHESVALYSVEDWHPDASSADNRGSSMISEGTKTTTEGAGRSESSEGALSNVVPVGATREGGVSQVPKQINIDAFAVETYLDEKETTEYSSNAYIQAMAASANPDILYYHEAMQAPDRESLCSRWSRK